MLDLLDPALLQPLLTLADGAPRKSPEPEDVKAGWTALLIWLGLAVAVGLLGWSLIRQLRKTNAARDAGVYGDPVARPGDEPGDDSRP